MLHAAEQEEAPKRSRRMPRKMVHIHVLQDYGYMAKARDHAELLQIACDWWSDNNVHILAISGTIHEIACMQSFVDGMNA